MVWVGSEATEEQKIPEIHNCTLVQTQKTSQMTGLQLEMVWLTFFNFIVVQDQ